MASNIVQYVVVRGDLVKSLKWPLGAVIAQACHAATAVIHLHREDEAVQKYLGDLDNMHKVVLEAKDEKSLRDLAAELDEADVKYKLWIEQPEDFATCLAAKPEDKTKIQKHFKRFKLFK